MIRGLIKNVVEPLLAKTVGKHLWAPVSVSVLAHGDHDDVLVLDTPDGYCLPGGLLAGSENLKEAGSREVKEETGCEVEIGNLLDIRHGNESRPGVHFFFEAEVVEADLDGNWEGEPEFVTMSKMRDLEWQLHHSHVHEYLFPEE